MPKIKMVEFQISWISDGLQISSFRGIFNLRNLKIVFYFAVAICLTQTL